MLQVLSHLVLFRNRDIVLVQIISVLLFLFPSNDLRTALHLLVGGDGVADP